MPTNVSPEYKKAEQAFREAKEPADRLRCLKEMLRTIPKHKGTEHVQAAIKTRIKSLNEELAGPRKGGARTGPTHTVRSEGAGQVSLLGPPNSGKSTLLAKLTGAKADIGPYPFTTKTPQPGMAPYEDVLIQLVDLPPITDQYVEPWIVNALQPADAALLVIDVADPECLDHIDHVVAQLSSRQIHLRGRPESDASENENSGDDMVDDSPFRIELPTVLVANKIDLADGEAELEALDELVDFRFPSVAVSALRDINLGEIPKTLFDILHVVRVYTKVPGKPPDTDRPFTIHQGDTVKDVATQVHKDIADTFRFARIWGDEVFDGQPVGPDHVLNDKDIIELHVK